MPNDLSSPVLDMPAATTAVLHGMMSTLSEVLGGIDGRIAALERLVREARAESGSPRALAQTVEAAVARLAERIEALEAAVVSSAAAPPARDDDLHAAVAALTSVVGDVAARPAVDEALRAAIADLAARTDAVHGVLAERPVRDEALHEAVAELAARPVADEELRAVVAGLHQAVAELATRPVRDEELHATVADLATGLHAAVADLAARPAVDEELRAAVADLAARPVADEDLRAAVADLAARPARDDELHQAVAELAARPVPVPGPDDPVRAGVTSLHERLNVLLDMVAQPPAPDDAVRLGLVALEEQVRALADKLTEALNEPEPEPQPVGPDPLLVDLAQRLAQWQEQATAADEEASTSLRLALSRLGEITAALDAPDDLDQRLGAVAADLAAVRDALVDHPAATLAEAIARVEQQVGAFVSQPGPGPAMAMVAAGLAERFESRTDGLVELLTALSRDLATLATAPASLDSLSARLDEVGAATMAATASLPEALAAERQAIEARLGEAQEALAAVASDLPDAVGARLDAAEAAIAERLRTAAAAVEAVPEAVAARLDAAEAAMAAVPEAVGARLDAAEAAIVAATAGLPDAVAARLDAAEAAIVAATAGVPEAVRAETAAVAEAVGARLAEAEVSLSAAVARVPEAVAADRDALAARLEASLTGLAAATDELRTAPADLARRVEDFVGVQFAELARREDAVAAALRDLQTAADPTVHIETLDRVRRVVEGQQGDVSAMREAVRSLYESVERHGAVSGQVAELLLENRAALGREVDRLAGLLAGQGDDTAERVRSAVDAVAQTQAGISAIVADAMATVRADVQALAATGQDPAQLNAVADRISESVRRESELLTQRVASLSVAVESLRTLVENSPGRKASEVGRRLAADLGIRPKTPAASGSGSGKKGKSPKSLGPGE